MGTSIIWALDEGITNYTCGQVPHIFTRIFNSTRGIIAFAPYVSFIDLDQLIERTNQLCLKTSSLQMPRNTRYRQFLC